VLLGLLALNARADNAEHKRIIQERDSTLSQILSLEERRLADGSGSDDNVVDAQLALYTFRRNAAATRAEKFKNQELMVQALQKKQAGTKARASQGVGGNIDVLLATDRLLEAQQVLEELKPTGVKG
jgi:hypothetical protein